MSLCQNSQHDIRLLFERINQKKEFSFFCNLTVISSIRISDYSQDQVLNTLQIIFFLVLGEASMIFLDE